MIPTALADLGEKFVKLGEAMQNSDTTLTELCSLAFDCGLSVQFRVTQRLPSQETQGTNDGAG